MKKPFLILFLLSAPSAWAGHALNINDAGVMLEGYDPVTYFKETHPSKGDPHYQVKQDGAIYWFKNEEDKQTFLKDPKKYQPEFGGWCAYAVADSKSKVNIDPMSYTIQDGRLLLFYRGLWGDTKKKWLNSKEKNEKQFLKEADANWPAVKDQEP